jgi:hypothetical protein
VFHEAASHEFLWKSDGAVPQIYEMTNVIILVKKNRDYGDRDPPRWPHDTPLSAKVVANFADRRWLVGIVHSRTKATELISM